MGPDKGIPIIQILYLSPLSILIPCFMATNSAPKTEVSIVACCFDSQMIGARLQKMINPVREPLVLFSPAWLLSSYEGQHLCQGEEACREGLLLPRRCRTPSIQKMGRQFGQCQGVCVCACPSVMRGLAVKHALTSTSCPPNDIPSIPCCPVVLPL
jgi:hypothetical protein